MSKFDVEEIPELRGKQRFFKLLVDGHSEFDDFVKESSNTTKGQRILNKIQTILMFVANLEYEKLPPTKYRELAGRKKNDPYKDYEVKVKNTRVYFFKDEIGRIIVMGSKKSRQKKDIKRFRKIKLDYFKEKRS